MSLRLAPKHRKQPALARFARRWVAMSVVAVVLALDCGCVLTGPGQWVRNGFKVGPNYCPPPAPVADEWISANNPDVQNRHLQDWWAVFQDPTLNSVIVTAYEQNPTLRIAGTHVLGARRSRQSRLGTSFLKHNRRARLTAGSTSTPTCQSSGRS